MKGTEMPEKEVIDSVDAESQPGTELAQAPETTAIVQPHPLAIIAQVAADPACDVAKLRGLMELKERHEANEARRDFAAAMATFQAKCPIIQKTRRAGSGRMSFQYAGLDDVMVQIRPLLAECGLSVSFSSDQDEKGNLHIMVTLQHGTHSEQREFTCPVPSEMRVNQTQKMGAALSYARRYALCGALNIIVSNEDMEPPPRPQPDQEGDAPPATTRQERAGPSLKDRVAELYQIWLPRAKERWPEYTKQQYQDAFRAYVSGVALEDICDISQWTPQLIDEVRARLDTDADPRPPRPEDE